MKVTDFYINGFGLFQNLKVERLGPGLTVFLGRNESGKSTLLGFMRAILFGFADGRSAENAYPPLAGGRPGGWIGLETQSGESCVVERYPGPGGGRVSVTCARQSDGDRVSLSALLGMAGRSLYKNVFAFSLTELQSFETLNTDAVKQAIFSAGAGVDPVRLTELQSRLARLEGDLFKPGGTKPRINQVLTELMLIQKEKRPLEDAVEHYDRARSQVLHLEGEIGRLEEKEALLRSELRKTEQWVNLWPDWVGLNLARRRIEELEPVDVFPADGLSRYEGLQNRRQDTENRSAEKEEELRSLETSLSELKKDLGLLSHDALIKKIQKGQGHFGAATKEFLSLKEELLAEERRLAEDLKHLGPSWTEEKVLGFDLSVETREEVRSYREMFRKADLEKHAKEISLDEAFQRKREAEQILRNTSEPSTPDEEDLVHKKRACQSLRTYLSEQQMLEKDFGNLRDRMEDLSQQKTGLEGVQSLGVSVLPLWPFLIIVAAVLLFLVWSWASHTMRLGLPVSGVGLSITVIFWIVRSGQMKEKKRRFEQGSMRLDQLSLTMNEVDERSRKVREQIENLRGLQEAAMKALGLYEVPGAEALERIQEHLTRETGVLDRWRKACQDVEAAVEKHEEALNRLKQTESDRGSMQETWCEWLEARGFGKALSAEGALESLSFVQGLREQIEHLGRLRSRLRVLQETKEGTVRLVNDALRAWGRREIEKEDEVELAIQELTREFSEAEEASHQRPLLEKAIDLTRASISRIREQLQTLERERKALILSAGAKDEEEFRKKAEAYEERRKCKKEIQNHESHLMRFGAGPGGIKETEEAFSRMDLEELEEKKSRTAAELQEVESRLERFIQERARLEEQLRILGADEKMTLLREREESLKEQLDSLSKEWSIIKLSLALLRRARARYEKEVQPEVISEAVRFFEQITLGKYPTLLAPIGENRIEVIDQDRQRKEIGQLSRGTAEQLYLALRFGFIREYSKRSEPLPLIMDEILVNFDSPRAKATASVLAEFSREHQIFYFTCHPETVALFREVDPRASVMEISGGAISPAFMP